MPVCSGTALTILRSVRVSNDIFNEIDELDLRAEDAGVDVATSDIPP